MMKKLYTMGVGMMAGLGGYALMIRPNTTRKQWAKVYENTMIAHRGFFDVSQGIPENSIPAFIRAVERGYGIELDIQLTKDKKMVVFHDETLSRMCGIDKKVRECTYEELKQYPLQGTEEYIPLFTEVMACVMPDTPLIIEIKPDGDFLGCAKQLVDYMEDYDGIYVVESFHPMVLMWLRRHAPHMIRGQLATDFFRQKNMKQPAIQKLLLSNMLFNFMAKPDFIAYNHCFADQKTFRLCRRLYGAKYAAWTIKSQEQLESARKDFSIFIFDSFTPQCKRK